MRAVVQRVKNAAVSVDNTVISHIQKGLLVYLGVGPKDEIKDVEYIADKIVNLRIFEDEVGKMNLSVRDVKGRLLIVPNFTLYADCRKGRRPSFTESAEPERAGKLYQQTIEAAEGYGVQVETGSFGSHMKVESVNDGPVTLLLDSKKLF